MRICWYTRFYTTEVILPITRYLPFDLKLRRMERGRKQMFFLNDLIKRTKIFGKEKGTHFSCVPFWLNINC